MNAVIALGSNLGNRAGHIQHSLWRLREQGVQVLRHSALYETAPAYVTDQPSFLNAAVLAVTHLPPRELLRVLKQVEAEAGRDLQGGPRFGPRPLDLDIICYGDGTYTDDRLQIPHPRWHERPFVLAPVSDLLYRRDRTAHTAAAPECSQQLREQACNDTNSSCSSSSSSYNPNSATRFIAAAADAWTRMRQIRDGAAVANDTAAHHAYDAEAVEAGCTGPGGGGGSPAAAAASARLDGGDVMRRVTPLINPAPPPKHAGTARGGEPAGGEVLLPWGSRTFVMGIINVTPDSFSDTGLRGGLLLAGGGPAAAVAAAERMVGDGADVVDVGGQSTRPGAARLSTEEELARVMPVIRALRQSPALRHIPISIDTFYSEVARQAVAAGANMVNDVSGGTLDPDMLRTVSRLGVPYVLMHMRGDPTTMTDKKHTAYDGCVWRHVGQELQQAAERAEACGIPAWNIILDPGIGFAKTGRGNVELLRHLSDMRRHALDGPYARGPLLVGPSRKGFLGTLTGRRDPADRDAATVAACVACVAGGADMVRVHNVRDVRDGVRVADAVYRADAVHDA